MITENVKKIFNTALQTFLAKEREGIIDNVSERNLCARFAIYIENLLPAYGLDSYFTDTEYNRKQNGEIKTILDEELQVIPINCDIILHSRGNNKKNDNLIAIEMKKSYQSKTEKDCDRKRLRALTKKSFDNIWSNDGKTHPRHVCGYVLGVYIELDNSQEKCFLEFYENGQIKSNEVLEF